MLEWSIVIIATALLGWWMAKKVEEFRPIKGSEDEEEDGQWR